MNMNTTDKYCFSFHDSNLFHSGRSYNSYRRMGAHIRRENGVSGVRFCLWAPNAKSVSVITSRTDWDEARGSMAMTGAGMWELFIPGVRAGDIYRYVITGADGIKRYKSDPYAFRSELRPANGSVVCPLSGYKWRDGGRCAEFSRETALQKPMTIYEVHLGSWKKDYRLNKDGFINYRRLADELAEYVCYMGYTHVELIGICEYPFDGSWGYQVTGYYSPTSRYGSPNDFRYFVDTMHIHGIGVILDWVPAHFPKDSFGLESFDGTALYESADPLLAEYPEWGTKAFDHSKGEVRSFLISNAFYWVREFHIDALRVDAVAAMLYLDYDRLPGEWIPNVYGTNENLEASAFFRKLNTTMKREAPGVLMIAEESTAFANITGLAHNGLGFDLKWNMGWMNDTLFYAQKECVYRKYHHDKLTFSLTYAFAERYVLPISHDEVVHGKKSFLDKMPEDYWRKFAGVRVFAAWEMTHPGKKLFFMGCEIGQFTEWDYRAEVEWQLLSYDSHAALQLYFAELNHLYLRTPALWEQDDSWQGFAWMDADDAQESIISFCRTDRAGRSVLVILNFTPATYEGYTQRVPAAGEYREIFNSDSTRYGGSGVTNGDTVFCAGPEKTIRLRVPPLGCTVLSVEEREENKESKEENQREDQKAK